MRNVFKPLFRELNTALRNSFSPVMGVDRREPILAWFLRIQANRPRKWRNAVIGAACALGFILGFAIVLKYFPASWRATEVTVIVWVVARMMLDSFAVTRCAGRLGEEFRSGRWDQMRMTFQPEARLLRSHSAVAHVTVWRAMLVVMCIQIGGMVGFVLVQDYRYPIGSYAVLTEFVGALFGIVLCGLELLLRPRTAVAVSLAVSARVPAYSAATIFGLIAMLPVWMVEVAAGLAGFLVARWGAGYIVEALPDYMFLPVVVTLCTVPLIAAGVLVHRYAESRLAVAVAARDASA